MNFLQEARACLSERKHMPDEWTEHKGFRYRVSPQADSAGQQRAWVYDVAGAIAGQQRILYHGQARSAAQAEAAARKWVGGQSATPSTRASSTRAPRLVKYKKGRLQPARPH
jgi:hypothetical protein